MAYFINQKSLECQPGVGHVHWLVAEFINLVLRGEGVSGSYWQDRRCLGAVCPCPRCGWVNGVNLKELFVELCCAVLGKSEIFCSPTSRQK